MEWKWTKNQPYERSKRLAKNAANDIEIENVSKDHEHSAYTSSLNYDENTWDILNNSSAQNGVQIINKREQLDSKMADRKLIQQTNVNPFLEQNNYVDDVSIRDQFLKPQNTTTNNADTNNNTNNTN